MHGYYITLLVTGAYLAKCCRLFLFVWNEYRLTLKKGLEPYLQTCVGITVRDHCSNLKFDQLAEFTGW